MSTNRIEISTVLIGSGPELGNLLAALSTRSKLLHLNIIACIDLGPSPQDKALDLARQIGIPVVGSHLEELRQAPPPDLAVLTVASEEVASALRDILPAGTPLLTTVHLPLLQGVIRLVEENRALRMDSFRLKETRLRLNQFVETASLAIYIKDADLRFKKVNRHALRILGVQEEDLIGRRNFTVFGGGGARWLHQVEQETLKTRRTLHATGALPIRGTEMHVKVTLFPIIENGLVEGLYGLIEDMTQLFESEQKRQQADVQLNETQKYLREVLENSRDIIFLTDPQGHILSFNSGAENSLGFTSDEVEGTAAHNLLVQTEVFSEMLQTALKDGHTTRYEVPFRSKDGHPVVCDVSMTLIDGPDGKPLEMVCLCRDITTRLRLKNDLIRSERLAAVGQMAAGVAHEINNPLAVIDTIAGLVEETIEEEMNCLDPPSRDLLLNAMHRLHAQVQRVTAITHSLLGFVRKADPGIREIDINELLDECLYVMGIEIRRSGAEVVRLFEPKIPRFNSDPMLLEQVFVNLIKNALDAMNEVPDRESVLEITTNLSAKSVTVRIQDNGIGIPPEDRDKIFNLFHTTKPAGYGTGLGLAIVHDILYRLGGSIRVASEPGQWTRFVVELPLQPPAPLRPDPSISNIHERDRKGRDPLSDR